MGLRNHAEYMILDFFERLNILLVKSLQHLKAIRRIRGLCIFDVFLISRYRLRFILKHSQPIIHQVADWIFRGHRRHGVLLWNSLLAHSFSDLLKQNVSSRLAGYRSD